MQKFINHLRTELFISARFNFVMLAFPVIQYISMLSWAVDITIKEAIYATVANWFVAMVFSLPIGIYRQYLKK